MTNIITGNSISINKHILTLSKKNKELAWVPERNLFESSKLFHAIHVGFPRVHPKIASLLTSQLESLAERIILSVESDRVLVTCDFSPKLLSRIRSYKGLFYETKFLKKCHKVEKEFQINNNRSIILSAVNLKNHNDWFEAVESYLGGLGGFIILGKIANTDLASVVDKCYSGLSIDSNSCYINKVKMTAELCNEENILFFYSPAKRDFFDLISSSENQVMCLLEKVNFNLKKINEETQMCISSKLS